MFAVNTLGVLGATAAAVPPFDVVWKSQPAMTDCPTATPAAPSAPPTASMVARTQRNARAMRVVTGLSPNALPSTPRWGLAGDLTGHVESRRWHRHHCSGGGDQGNEGASNQEEICRVFAGFSSSAQAVQAPALTSLVEFSAHTKAASRLLVQPVPQSPAASPTGRLTETAGRLTPAFEGSDRHPPSMPFPSNPITADCCCQHRSPECRCIQPRIATHVRADVYVHSPH